MDGAILDLIRAAGPPVTARQTFYMAAARHRVAKDDKGYRTVLRRLSAMREAGTLPWSWIADNTRWVREPITYANLGTAMADWQELYRRDYWRTQPDRLELWVESDSIASFLGAIANRYAVPMFVCRGQSSKSYIHGAAETARSIGKPVRVLYLGDFDPTGVMIDRSVDTRYRQYLGGADLTVTRIGITPDQIREFHIEGGPAKRSDPNYRTFAELCRVEGLPVEAIETEALPPNALRQLVLDAIEDQIDAATWQAVANWERAEREQLSQMLGEGR